MTMTLSFEEDLVGFRRRWAISGLGNNTCLHTVGVRRGNHTFSRGRNQDVTRHFQHILDRHSAPRKADYAAMFLLIAQHSWQDQARLVIDATAEYR